MISPPYGVVRWLASKALPGCLAAATAALTCGCFHLDYLAQAAYGQDEIAFLAEPIEDVLLRPSLPARTRQLLSLIDDVKAFGEVHALDPTNNYRDYVQLDRPVVVYVVSASKPLAFESVTWSFPVVGSVPYLGWFNRRDAKRQAKELRAEGYDVDERGATAYSTLGWFSDPVLSTMIRHDESALGSMINVVLHESVHATHYVNGQTFFNESMADFVADRLTLEYLRDRLHADRWTLLAFQQLQYRGALRARRFHETYQQLAKLYASKLPDDDKLKQKQRIVGQLRAEFGFWRPINNATLAQSRQYHGGTPEFGKLLRACGGDWKRFWKAAKTIDADAFAKPQQEDLSGPVMKLVRAGCGG